MNTKKILTLVALAGTFHAGMWAAAPGNRVIYGFNRASAEWASSTKEYDCGFVSYPFDLSENGTVLTSYLFDPSLSLYAGAGIDGIIYGCEYNYVTSLQAPIAGDFISYNVYNGHIEHIGPWEIENSNFKPSDMTYDPKSGKMYAVGFDAGTGLYEVDYTTGQFTLLFKMESGGTLAADPHGTLYTITNDGVLCTINMSNGRLTEVFDTGLSGMLRHQSMEFDHTTGKLYWASCTVGHPQGYENVWLQEIDLTDSDNITIKEVGRVGILSTFVAMYIPSADSLDAPAAPTNVKSTPGANGAFEAHLSWTNPTETFGGEDVGKLYGVVIKRNGETVKTFGLADVEPEMTYTDEVSEKGNYRYDIQAINAAGTGAKGTAFQFIGADKPATVVNAKGTVGTDMASVILTWDTPVESYLGGSFDPEEITYKVTRNDGVVIGDNLTETTVTDKNIRRLRAHTYSIEAINAEGSTALDCGPFIAGPAIELPFEQTFENEMEVRNLWGCFDGNDDSFSWIFGTPLGHALFGDYESCVEYLSSPTLGVVEDADEWLISPPLKFEGGVEYEFTMSARCFGITEEETFAEETVDFYLGSLNNVESMTTKLGSATVGDNGFDDRTDTRKFVRYSVDIPVFEEDALAAVALHLVTPHNPSSYFQANGLFVGEKGVYSGLGNVSLGESDVVVSVNHGILTIVGDFRDAKVFNLQGICVANPKGALTDLSNLGTGVYVLNIDGKSFKVKL